MRLKTLCATMLLASPFAVAQTTVLYQAGPGATPQSSGYLLYADNSLSSNYFSSSSTATTLNTTDGNGISAGFASHDPLGGKVNPAFPSLNPSIGFNAKLSMKFNSLSNADEPDRSGFSMILLGSDKKGIELGFTLDPGDNTYRVFAQNAGATEPPRFTRGESAVLPSPLVMSDYVLSITGSSYKLLVDDVNVLSGVVRDYTDEPDPAPIGTPPFVVQPGNPYRTADFFFFGDNTSRQSVSVDLTFASISVPEPGMLALLLPGAVWMLRRR